MRLEIIINHIKDRYPEMLIKIGAEHGSGYFFIGTVSEYVDNYDRLIGASKGFAEVAYDAARAKVDSKKTKKNKRMAERAKSRLDAYIEPNLREVIDFFDADKTVDDGIVIMVEGYESGRYWTQSERKKRSPYEPLAVGMTQSSTGLYGSRKKK